MTSSENMEYVKIFNLCDHILTKEEKSVLGKGLKFAPTKEINNFDLFVDVQRFIRKLSLKRFFSEKEECDEGENTAATVFKPKSTFFPKHCKGNFVETFEHLVLEDVKRLEGKRVRDRNLTKKEKEALRDLGKNEKIIIKPADKGGGVVILNKEDYKGSITSAE